MNKRPYLWIIAGAALATFPALAGQTALQKPPRLINPASIKIANVAVVRFGKLEAPTTVTPKQPTTPTGALYGRCDFDTSRTLYRVYGGETERQFVGMKVIPPSPTRPIIFEFEIDGPTTGKHQLEMFGSYVTEDKYGQRIGHELNKVTMEATGLRQHLSITVRPVVDPKSDGFVQAGIWAKSKDSNFELVSITARPQS